MSSYFKQFFQKVAGTFNACYLCLRFPFLYPRNRFTGKHYNNWKIIDYHKKHFSEAFRGIPLDMINKDAKEAVHDGKRKKYRLLELFTINEGKKFLAYKIMLLDWINDHPLQWLHAIPTHTELDFMPTGWRKAFGIQMCKEIKDALLKDGGRKLLRSYRIVDIKEKYGSLRWYDNYSSPRVWKVILKYEYISSYTCVICGDLAVGYTPVEYWKCPYCEAHKPMDSNYFLYYGIDENESWYGYTGNINRLKEKELQQAEANAKEYYSIRT